MCELNLFQQISVYFTLSFMFIVPILLMVYGLKELSKQINED